MAFKNWRFVAFQGIVHDKGSARNARPGIVLRAFFFFSVQLCETVEELAPTEQSGLAALQAAVKRATAKYFGALAPVGSRSSLEGVMALHTALEEQLDDDDMFVLFLQNVLIIILNGHCYFQIFIIVSEELGVY